MGTAHRLDHFKVNKVFLQESPNKDNVDGNAVKFQPVTKPTGQFDNLEIDQKIEKECISSSGYNTATSLDNSCETVEENHNSNLKNSKVLSFRPKLVERKVFSFGPKLVERNCYGNIN